MKREFELRTDDQNICLQDYCNTDHQRYDQSAVLFSVMMNKKAYTRQARTMQGRKNAQMAKETLYGQPNHHQGNRLQKHSLSMFKTTLETNNILLAMLTLYSHPKLLANGPSVAGSQSREDTRMTNISKRTFQISFISKSCSTFLNKSAQITFSSSSKAVSFLHSFYSNNNFINCLP